MSKLPKKERRQIGKEIRSERKQYAKIWRTYGRTCFRQSCLCCWGPHVEK